MLLEASSWGLAVGFPTRISDVPAGTCAKQEALQPAQSAARGAIERLAQLVSQQPDLQFPISSDRAQSWLINTFLDEVLLPHKRCRPLARMHCAPCACVRAFLAHQHTLLIITPSPTRCCFLTSAV